MEGNCEFQVSAEELHYLKQLASQDQLVAGLLRLRENAQMQTVTICLSHNEAEQLRGYLTERLAAVGFGESYSVNDQGRILEKLIDVFYVR